MRPPYTSSAFGPASAGTHTPNSTLRSERFIARHIIVVRMMPDAPTSEPVMMSALLFSTKPVAVAASPE
jgi:hypothetical protein